MTDPTPGPYSDYSFPAGVEEKPKKVPPVQNWRQATSTRFDTYKAAREAYEASEAERRRVRRRAGGWFDFVVYERLPKPEATKEEQVPHE